MCWILGALRYVLGDMKGETRSLDYSSYRKNGKENGNYRDYRDYIGAIWGLYS